MVKSVRVVQVLAFLIVVYAVAAAPPPPVGWTTEATVINVYDGDTVELEIKRIVTVRLLDCWAPEIRTKNAAEKQKGFESKHHLARLLPKKSTVILHIPGEEKIKNVFTFGRVLGHIWPKEQEKNVSELQVEAGHATAKKEKK